METTLSIQFPVRMTDDKTGFTYVQHDNMHATVYAGSLNTAKNKLRPMVQEAIDSALRQVAEYRQHFIGCTDGTVLLVQFRHGNWGYEIAGPGRKWTSGVSGHASYDDAIAAAKRHADNSYGGVSWEV